MAVGQSNTGWISPGTATAEAGGGANWASPSNILSSNNTYSYAVSAGDPINTTSYIQATNFSFTIPSGATINGVEVSIEHNMYDNLCEDEYVIDYNIRLLINGSVTGDNNAQTLTNWGLSDETFTYGGSSNTWGLTLAESDIEDTDFGVRIIVRIYDPSQCYAAQSRIDHVQMKVYYTVASSAQKNIFIWSNF
jgi:hypothetical protein